MQWERGPAVDVETFTWRALFLFWSAACGRFLDSQAICDDAEQFPDAIEDLAEHLMTCVTSLNHTVSMKGCLCVRHLAEDVREFRVFLRRCPEALELLAAVARPPTLAQARSLEREEEKFHRIAAERALRAILLESSEREKASVRARCEGFGNYMPPPDPEEQPQTGAAGFVNEIVGFVGDAVADTVDDFREKGPDHELQIMDSVASVWGFLGGRRLRGAWLTDDLAVQRIHGFGLLAVRIICVRAADDAHKQKLVDFFRRDERNLRARFLATGDPLDGEPRVLLKVPYDRSLDGWVEHEWEVLQDLQGIPGVPKLAGPALFFEDLGVRALALEFTGMPSLQQLAESRRKPATEELFRMTIFFVGTLEKVHQRGWLHADLQPKDLLVLDKSAAWQPLRQTTESMMQEEPIGLICGWTHAMRWTADAAELQRREVCAQLQELLGTGPLSVASAISLSGVVSVAESYSSDKQFRSRLASLPSPSAFSAPEQFVTLFTGQEPG
ncbi:hypothetical protein AK812_SmicGene600 [Symbiodinium microadriaticum]|uniref:Protein kinase domain-containing protein n=2 Tax=Symbiodinium TaxID=2949 RepID=A0A1Q9F672_SYMMI|nr:hypothetical protein AK812_SmicGene600 [Symbiodinium microadriaticum]